MQINAFAGIGIGIGCDTIVRVYGNGEWISRWLGITFPNFSIVEYLYSGECNRYRMRSLLVTVKSVKDSYSL